MVATLTGRLERILTEGVGEGFLRVARTAS